MVQKIQYESNYLDKSDEKFSNSNSFSSSFIDKKDKELNFPDFEKNKNPNFQSKKLNSLTSPVEKNLLDKKDFLKNSTLQNPSIIYLNISNRSRKLLEKSKIYNLSDLLKRSAIELRQIQGFGEKCLQEIKKALQEIGLELKND